MDEMIFVEIRIPQIGICDDYRISKEMKISEIVCVLMKKYSFDTKNLDGIMLTKECYGMKPDKSLMDYGIRTGESLVLILFEIHDI